MDIKRPSNSKKIFNSSSIKKELLKNPIEIKTADKKLDSALLKIQEDKSIREAFYKDPVKSLESMGIDTDKFNVDRVNADFLDRLDKNGLTVCVTIGEIIGVSVGT